MGLPSVKWKWIRWYQGSRATVPLLRYAPLTWGGIPGNATVDHLVALKEAANQILKRGKTAYMIFLDVQKAYDKAWLDAILYALYRNGVGKKNLEIIRKLNTGLTARNDSVNDMTSLVRTTAWHPCGAKTLRERMVASFTDAQKESLGLGD